MSVNWDCSKCEGYHAAKEFGDDSPEWITFADMRESLIWILLVTKFPPKSGWSITEKNWEEIYTRIVAVEKVSDAYRIYSPAEDETEVKKIYFTPDEIHSMIGFSVNAGNSSKTEFMKWMYKRATQNAEYDLKDFRKSQIESE